MGNCQTHQLEVENFSVHYGRRQVLHDMTLAPMRAGRVTALLGPNGSGKSTFMRGVAGLTRAEGCVRLAGQDLSKLGVGERARLAAYLPQSLPPAVHLQVIEAVMEIGRAHV